MSAAVTCSAASVPGQPKQVNAAYRIYVHGFNIARVQVTYKLAPKAYAVRTDVIADGLLSLILRMKIISHAEGYFTPRWVSPLSFKSAGETRGAYRRVTLTYDHDTPSVTELSPAEPDREPVSADGLGGAIDTLSAMAILLHRFTEDGSCNGGAKVFDGLRLTKMTIKGPTRSSVPESYGQEYLGSYARCDFIGQQVAGFIRGSLNRAKMGAAYPGSVWFGTFPDAGVLAVRFSFEHPKLGNVTAVLDRFSTS